ncbi:hypothetical protein PVL29_002323 [Vitis rotundifolia]|uniref:Xyloglucan endotransglucosylase/hydrolase n=1 Tax=Vitis rotundifolia TaxID=103349 RepID=A0AA39E3Q9_VITRO|nr:hypothetical protein PVL29_002323 [Vitis rotundifolia]
MGQLPVRRNFSLFFLFFFFFFFFSFFCAASSFNLSVISFDQGYTHLFGEGNLVRSSDGRSVRLLLDRYTGKLHLKPFQLYEIFCSFKLYFNFWKSSGSGFISANLYKHGFFSANIKLPSEYTAGVVVAFYTSNGDVFEKTHDELDFEFLGNVKGKPWRFQTNVYGNGSTSRGREERYRLWFDPSKEFHRYSILWTAKNIIFYVDEVPIREVIRNEAMGGDYPSKPMSLYATIWDASNWATSGGKYKVDYNYAPFVSEFSDFVLDGCPADPLQLASAAGCSDKDAELESNDYSAITPLRRISMRKFRQKYMYYSYCYDTLRYATPPPECVIIPSEKRRFQDTGRLKFGGSHKKSSKRRSRVPVATTSDRQAAA